MIQINDLPDGVRWTRLLTVTKRRVRDVKLWRWVHFLQYAIENNKSSGATVNWTDVQSYLKNGSVLYSSSGTDLFGNFYGSSGTFSPSMS